jgi:MinD superfamily P-loop ATPase
VGEYHWATIQGLKAFFDGCDVNLADKCNVIINRSEWLPQDVIDECRQNLGREIYAEIPYDPPLEASRKIRENSAFAKAMKKMAAGLIPEATP